MRLSLGAGSYSTRSIIASAQRCINYYPELNERGNPVPYTHYQRPGLVPMGTIGTGPIRGLWQLSNGVGYCVSGSQLFRVNADFTGTFMGDITAGRTNLCSMVDNGDAWLLVDGSTTGWTGALGGTDFAQYVDPTGQFRGADRVDYLDTFTIWNDPNTRFWGSTESNKLTISSPQGDDIPFIGKTGWPDLVQTVYANRREVIVLGTLKGEVYYNAGLPMFPFAALPGAFIEHGIASKYCISHQDIMVYWVSRNLQGEGMVLRYKGYQTERISNHALEFAIREMTRTVGIDDAIGFTYQLDGHVFYQLTFPKGDQTWVYDASIPDNNLAWHQEAWTAADGTLHRHRANCHAVLNNANIVGDWQNGTLYHLSLNAYVDRVGGAVSPITCIRSFAHIGQGRLQGTGQMVQLDGRRVQFAGFRADMECGMAPVEADGGPAKITLRWSDDRGRTWGTDVLQSDGMPGEYLTQPQWLGLGVARDRVFELSHKVAGPAALNGAWIDCEVLGT